MADFSNEKRFLSVSSEDIEGYLDLAEKAKKQRDLMAHGFRIPERKTKIEDVITEKEKIKNESLRQDIDLKKKTLDFLCRLLFIETFIVFLFSFFQAVNWPMYFRLEEWSFKLLVTATISQITIMLLVAVKHLFPSQK